MASDRVFLLYTCAHCLPEAVSICLKYFKNNAHILYLLQNKAKVIDSSSFGIFHTCCEPLCISSQVYAFSSLKYPWHAGNIFPMLKSLAGFLAAAAFGVLAFVSSRFCNGLHLACGLCWKVTSAKAFQVDLTVLGSSVSVRFLTQGVSAHSQRWGKHTPDHTDTFLN